MKIFTFILLVLALSACNSKPKVIEAESDGAKSDAPIFQEAPLVQGGNTPATPQEEHTVVVEEAMNTERYSYLRVKENGQEFWIAISRRDVKIGGTYNYRGGLLKKNFQSQEFNRVFETIYLVSDFRDPAESAGSGSAMTSTQPAAVAEPPTSVTPAAGAIKISELIANRAKYDGKVVKVTGKCVKVNNMIMGRNWIHLQDGSGKNLDLTVTSTESVPLGAIVTLEGTFGLNKDFGAGYRYDYIVEGAVLK
ncbi:MAG: SH3-like domain-containing protein [Saprospiraceae bacterium]|nr:SH3-like domain-containing protein [Saprospiraceae bacterium]